ncbi:hypothetical protein Tco_0052912, partial [Tanacetum coccineum]
IKNELRKLKGKNVINTVVSKPNATTIALGMFKLDLEPLAPKVLKNKDARIDYIKHSREHADTLWEIVENTRELSPLDSNLDSACKYVERIQEVLVYVKDTCTCLSKPRLICSTGASGSKPIGNTKKNKISQSSSSNKTNKVEDQSRSVKSRINNRNHVSKTECNVNVTHFMLNANSKSNYAICNECLFDENHDKCVLDKCVLNYIHDVNVLSKSKSAKCKNKKQVWKPTGKVYTNIGYKWKPIGRTFNIVGNKCPLTRFTSTKIVSLKETTIKSVLTPTPGIKIYSRRPKATKSVGCPNCSLVFGLRMLQAYDRKPLSAHQFRQQISLYRQVSTDTPYPPVGYDVSTLLLRQRIDQCSLNNVSILSNVTIAASEWLKKDCIGSVTTWEDLVEKFVQKFYQLSNNNEEMEADESDYLDDIAEIFKIEGNLFDYETPFCKAFNDFNYLLKIDTDVFTFDIQGIMTYEEYELNNTMIRDLEEPWLDNGVPYQLCDHICEPYRFKNGMTKWPTYSSDIDGLCNSVELPGMVRVGCRTYFQDHKWYDELADGKLKEETLMHKAKVEESWGDATPGVIKLCAWLKSSFENFHEVDYNVLVKLEECWWKVNAHEVAPFTRWENYGQGPYANAKTERAYNPYLDINHIFGRSYGVDNVDYTQDNQEHKKEQYDPLTCRVRRFKGDNILIRC